MHLQFVRDRRTGLTHNVLEVCGSERGVRYVMAQDSEIAKDRDKYQLRAHLQAERIEELEAENKALRERHDCLLRNSAPARVADSMGLECDPIHDEMSIVDAVKQLIDTKLLEGE